MVVPTKAHCRIVPYSKAQTKIQSRYPYLSIIESTYKDFTTPCQFFDAELNSHFIKKPTLVYYRGFGHPARNKEKLLAGTKKAGVNKRLTSYEVERKIQTIQPYISIDHSTYESTSRLCWLVDTELNIRYQAKPSNALRGSGCKERGLIEALKKYKSPKGLVNPRAISLQEVKTRMPPELKIIESTYQGWGKTATFIDPIYGEFTTKPLYVCESGVRHPKHKKGGKIKGKLEEIFKTNLGTPLLDQRMLNFSPDTHTTPKYLKEIDFYFPDRKIGIEYHGLYWHGQKSPEYHEKKYHIALGQHINLIQIWANEWRDSQPQILSHLKSLFHKQDTIVQADNCIVQEIDPSIAFDFLQANSVRQFHELQPINYGLFIGNVLQAAISARIDRDSIYIHNWAYRLNTEVEHGLGKLIHSISLDPLAANCQTINIISDNRWGRGGVYQKLGFYKANKLPPNFYYIKHDNIIPVDKMPTSDNLNKIYDAGYTVWKLPIQTSSR